MCTLQTKIELHKVSKISIFIQLLASLHKSVKLIELYLVSRLFYDFLGRVELITRMNECITCSGSGPSKNHMEDPSINSLEN